MHRRGDQDRSWSGELLHTGRQVRRLADRRVVHGQVVADRPHHDVAGVQAHAHLEPRAVGALRLIGVLTHGGLHGQGRVTGAHGVVFVGHRRPEQGHDAVAEHLVHGALVAVHGVHHDVQRRVEQRLGLLRIEVRDQLCRALEISKEHRDLFALAFQGSAGGEDFLGQVRWRIRQRGTGLDAGRC